MDTLTDRPADVHRRALVVAFVVVLTLVIIAAVVALARHAWPGRWREHFAWADWGENTERENFGGSEGRGARRAGFIGGAMPCADRFEVSAVDDAAHAEKREITMMHRYGVFEGFSPDAPGACSQAGSPAATREQNALRVLAGF